MKTSTALILFLIALTALHVYYWIAALNKPKGERRAPNREQINR